MPGFILLLYRDKHQYDQFTPEEMARVVGAYGAWATKMRNEGRFVGGSRLLDGGKSVSENNGRPVVTDGPYAESKEIVGGFFSITAKDIDEACAVARACPSLQYGGRVEVREIG